MDKSAIRNFSIEARKILMKSAETEAGFYGVTRKGCKSPIQKGNDFEVYETLAGTENRIYGADIKKRVNLVEAVETLGFDQVIEETAYTWFNRIIAIRFMEVNGYLPTRVRVLSSETGSNTPDIVTQSLDVDLNMTPEELEKVQKAKDENRYDDAFRMLFVKQCNELNTILPGLFEKTDDYMELLLKLSYTNDGVVRMLVDTVVEDNFNVETEGQVEIIGWMYQYYNTELKDDTFAQLKKNVKITKERIPAATQLFTPDWIVRYMVENSVGRVWIEHLRAMDSSIDEKAKAEEFGWKYYLPEAEQETEVQEKLVEIRKSYLGLEPKDITCIDPCMGSGHILVYMFDVLMDIYRSEGFSERDAVFSILENNIRGLDIDRRAYQLSYFALMMMARRYNRRFFNGITNSDGSIRLVNPLVFAIDESNKINRHHLEYFGQTLEIKLRKYANEQIAKFLDNLVDAKDYGSILEVKNYNWELLLEYIAVYDIGTQVSINTYGIDDTQKKVTALLYQGMIIAEKYYIVATNPPYMSSSNMNLKLNKYLREYYEDGKNDLFAAFIEKCLTFTNSYGYTAMITMHSWMFLSRYSKLRDKVLRNDIWNMLHLGSRAFEEIGGEVVQTVSFIIRQSSLREYNGKYIRLVDYLDAQQKEKNLKDEKNCYLCKQNNYEYMVDHIVAYWANKRIYDIYKSTKLLEEYSDSRQGIATGNNDIFLRLWYEPEFNKICFDADSQEVMNQSEKLYAPYNKGGSFRRWYGNQDYIIKIDEQNYEKLLGMGNHLPSRQYYYKSGITWNDISTKLFCARYVDNGFVFDAAGPTCFYNGNKKYLLGFLNSSVAQDFLNIICQGLHYSTGHIPNLPYICNESSEVEGYVDECLKIAKSDWDSIETSWNFEENILIKMHKKTGNYLLEEDCKEVCAFLENERDSLLKTEQKINQYFSDLYNMPHIESIVSPENLTIRQYDKKQIVIELISYSVGCMFGRFSLDYSGIAYAGGEWRNTVYKTIKPDEDGIISITENEYLQDDIVTRFADFISILYGNKNLEDNLFFIGNCLGNKGNTSREKIRNYFLNDFYRDHCSIYSVSGSGKRPIYWLFDSGKENGFKCLIYMHRYTKDTLNLIRSEYLHKVEDAVENALKNVDYIVQTSTSAVEKAKATKDRDKYVKQINEMRIYYQALSHLAIQKIEIDLDNGVKNNYQLFQGIEVIVDGGKKQIVDLLAKI